MEISNLRLQLSYDKNNNVLLIVLFSTFNGSPEIGFQKLANQFVN